MRLILHNRDQKSFGVGKECSTVVVDKPDVREIFQELRKQYTKSCMQIPKIVVNIGGAFVHYKDSFNKKLGRKLAESRMKPIEMRIGHHGMYDGNPDAIFLVLTGVDSELEVHYSLNVKVYRDSGEMRVMACYTRSWR